MNALVFVAALSVSMAVSGAVLSDGGLDRLYRELARLETNPCQTTLIFQDLLFDRYIACESCAAIPADRLYPEAVIEMVDRWAVNGQISFTGLMELSGQCPQ